MSKLSPELFTASVASYEEAREHSEMVDQILGFKVPDIERGLLERAQLSHPNGSHKTWGQSIHQGNQTWVGLSHQTLQTPYSELKQMCELLDPSEGTIGGPGSRVWSSGIGAQCSLSQGAFHSV